MSSPDLEEVLRRSEEFAVRLIESGRGCIKLLNLDGRLPPTLMFIHCGDRS